MNAEFKEVTWQPMINTPKGQMKCTSLRPGDFLSRGPVAWDDAQESAIVMINSSKLERIVLLRDSGETSETHEYLMGHDWRFIGHGKRRIWWFYLPKFLQKRVCLYSKP